MLQNMGVKIKDKRKELKMTLAELGRKVGVQASTVRKWETGYIKDIRSDKIQKVAQALTVTPAYLIGWEETNETKYEDMNVNEDSVPYGTRGRVAAIYRANREPLSKEEMELLRIFKELSVRSRMQLLTIAMELETEEASV